MIISPGMPPMDLGAKDSIRSHYDLATPFYRLFWGPHIHHGLWSAEDAVREQPHASPRAAQEALTDAVATLARHGCSLQDAFDAMIVADPARAALELR